MSEILHRMDRAKMTGLHRRLAWSAGLGIFLDGYDLVIIGAALIQIVPQWHLTPLQTGLIGGAALQGSFVGALLGGYIADRWGRKVIYLLDLATFFVAALLCSISWSFLPLYVFRLLLGIGIGADYPLSATYMAEFMPANRRGRVITWTFGLWPAGAIVAGFTGYALLRFVGADAWRWMLALGALPALFVLYLRRNLPESPRWYLRRNDPQAAGEVLKRVVPELTQPEIDAMIEAQRAVIVRPKVSPLALFSPRFLRSTLFVCVPWFLMDLAGYYFVIYKPQLLSHLGYKTHESQLLWSAIINFVYPFGFIPLAYTVDKIGRIGPQILGFVFCALAIVVVVFAGDTHPVIVCLGLLLNTIFISFGPGSTTYILPAEVYPTDVRATGHGFATAVSRAGAVFSGSLCPSLAAWLGTSFLLWFLAGTYLAGAITTWIFRVQTTSKPLIEDELAAALPESALQMGNIMPLEAVE